MRLVDLQVWAYRTIEALLAEQPTEDAVVELKTIWPEDHADTARRIAGQANAARGEPILWLIGVNETARTVPGVQAEELSTWWAQVKKHFADGVHPAIQDLVVPYKDVRVVALALQTETPPYATKRPNTSGVPDIEVPWREGTSTRPATRQELVLLLADAVELPTIYVRWAKVEALVRQEAGGDVMEVYASLQAYVDSVPDKHVTFPFDKCSATVEGSPGSWASLELNEFSGRIRGDSPHVFVTQEDMVFTGPAAIRLEPYGRHPSPVAPPVGDVKLRLELLPTRSDIPVRCEVLVPFIGDRPDEPGSSVVRGWRWDMRDSSRWDTRDSQL